VAELKEERQRDRRKRERLKMLHLVVAGAKLALRHLIKLVISRR
jgi:hypothetical protein